MGPDVVVAMLAGAVAGVALLLVRGRVRTAAGRYARGAPVNIMLALQGAGEPYPRRKTMGWIRSQDSPIVWRHWLRRLPDVQLTGLTILADEPDPTQPVPSSTLLAIDVRGVRLKLTTAEDNAALVHRLLFPDPTRADDDES